jgi:ABC-2 type transport system ATP-binding protein
VLRVDNLRKRFGDVTALDRCTFSVSPGQMLGLLGPNGAGKTTAMRGVFGLMRPDGGEVSWNGRPIAQRERRGFGYMPEERGLYPKLPVRWQLAYLGRLHGMSGAAAEKAANDWLDRFSLLDRADSKVTELSHGNQQRVQLVAALIHAPELVILDEPFAGLDPIGASFMAEVLAKLASDGVAVVFSSHQLDVVEDLCREVVIMDRGRVVLEGKVKELRAASADRYVEVTGGDSSWVSRVPEATIVEESEDRMRILLGDSVGLDAVSRLVAGSGAIEFTFEPPPLSEVFKRAVSR